MSTTKNTNPVEHPEFAERLKRAVEEKGFNQSSFAKALDLKQGHVSAWFTGKSRPSKLALTAIELLLGVSKVYLITGRGTRYSQPAPNFLVLERREDYKEHQLRKKLATVLTGCESALATARQDIDKILTVNSAQKLSKMEEVVDALESGLGANRRTGTADLGSSHDSDASGVKRVSDGAINVGRQGKVKNRQR